MSAVLLRFGYNQTYEKAQALRCILYFCSKCTTSPAWVSQARVRVHLYQIWWMFNWCDQMDVIIDKVGRLRCSADCWCSSSVLCLDKRCLFSLCGCTRAPCVTIVSHASLSLIGSIASIAGLRLIGSWIWQLDTTDLFKYWNILRILLMFARFLKL